MSSRPASASASGGLVLTDEEDTRSVVLEIIKSLGRKIIQGNFTDVMKVSRPASISYPLTYLQAASRDFVYCELLEQAATVPDPIRRLQLVTAFLIASLHINPLQMKNKPPLNPVLGETYHAVKPNGTEIFLEQTSHHPPVSNWDMRGAQYRFYGHAQIVAGLSGPNSLHASKRGLHRIEFADGGVIEYVCPSLEISGLVYGERTVNFIGSCEVSDPVSRMKCEITFGGYTGMVSWLAGSLTSWWSKAPPTDYFTAVVKQYSGSNKHTVEICKGEGSWLDFVEFGGEKLWCIGQAPVEEWAPGLALDSDSSLREDLRALVDRDVERAQQAKDEIENRQRRDKTLRGSKMIN